MTDKLFGTSGIRGDAIKLFTPQFCYDIGVTFIEFLKKIDCLGPIAIGMDPRTSSPRIKKDLILGLSQSGYDIFDEGICPIPSVNWLIKNTEVKAAVMITGSHIASHLNGLKFYAHNEEITLKDQELIEKLYQEFKNKPIKQKNINAITDSRATQLYETMLLKLAKGKYPNWKMALDCANGSQSVVIPSLIKKLGINITEVNCDVTSDFIARDTDTDDKAQIEELKKSVVNYNCDFGIAFDGDGDRVVFIDEKGQFVQGEYSCGLVAKNTTGETIVTTISASQVVDTLGKKVVRTKVGSPFVIDAMKKSNAVFGFEQNGGAISPEIQYTRDGGTMMIKLLNLYSQKDGSFSDMIGELKKYYMSRTKVDYKLELKDNILNLARKSFKYLKTEEVDGLKIWLDETTWILFRSSQNAPEFRVFAESTTYQKSNDLLKEGINLVGKVIKEN